MEWLSAATTSRFSRKFLLGKSVVNIFCTFVHFRVFVCIEVVEDIDGNFGDLRQECFAMRNLLVLTGSGLCP